MSNKKNTTVNTVKNLENSEIILMRSMQDAVQDPEDLSNFSVTTKEEMTKDYNWADDEHEFFEAKIIRKVKIIPGISVIEA